PGWQGWRMTMSEKKRLHPISVIVNIVKQLKDAFFPLLLLVIVGNRTISMMWDIAVPSAIGWRWAPAFSAIFQRRSGRRPPQTRAESGPGNPLFRSGKGRECRNRESPLRFPPPPFR